MIAKILHKSNDIIGEAATWLEASQLLIWVDIERCLLHVYDPATTQLSDHLMPARVSTIIPTKDKNTVILALQGRLVSYNLQTKEMITVMDVEADQPDIRTNDGKASPEGRLWLGTMHLTDHNQTGSLYCVETNLSIRKVLEKQYIPNGIAWNKAGTGMYYADSGRSCIEEYSYDRISGNLEFVKVAIQVPSELGVPDGMTIDSDDNLWVAHWGGFGVYIWNPGKGELIDKIEVPVPNVASCTFGGKNKNQLFITTARAGLTSQEILSSPLSGGLFVADVSVEAGENHFQFNQNKF